MLVEPDPATSSLGLDRIEEALTLLTRAIIPVHCYGQPCRMPKIMILTKRHRLLVIEGNTRVRRRKIIIKVLGYSSKLDELQAAVLRMKLNQLAAGDKQHQQFASCFWYDKYLTDVLELRLPTVALGAVPVWHLLCSAYGAAQCFAAALGRR